MIRRSVGGNLSMRYSLCLAREVSQRESLLRHIAMPVWDCSGSISARLRKWQRTPRVYAVSLPLSTEPALQDTVLRTAFPPVHDLGLRGQGVKVAVIDTSFWLGALNDVIAERHCFCGSSCCANGTVEQHGGSNGATLTGSSTQDHAVFVASVIANTNNGGGTAPSTDIVAIGTRLETSGLADQINALNWLVTRPDIPVVNMSFSHGLSSHGPYPGVCDGAPEQAALLAMTSALYSSGRVLVAAAGNQGNAGAMSAPACLSTTVSAAATWNCTFDGIACTQPDAHEHKIWFSSNASTTTDVAAPGAMVSLYYPGGYFANMSGTSFAAPAVSGCSGLLKQAVPNATPEQIRAALKVSPMLVTRPGYGNYPMLHCQSALDHLLESTGIRLNQHGLTGSWYNPSTSGQGLVLEVYEDSVTSGQGTIFGGLFTFSKPPAGDYDKQRWYTINGNVNNTMKVANLTISANYGGNFDAPPSTSSVVVGMATLHFDTCTQGTLTYTFTAGTNAGLSGAMPLHRMLANPGCVEIGGGSTANRFKLSGAWYNPSISGQGLMIEINPDSHQLFAGWFTYAPDGQSIGGPASQRWYSLSAAIPATGSIISNLPIYGTTHGVFDAPPTVTTQQVGLATLSFSSCSAGTLSYSFMAGPNAGMSGSLSLTRTGAIPVGCTL